MLIFAWLDISINLMSFHHLRISSSLQEMSPCMYEARLVKWFNHGDGTLTSGLLNEAIFWLFQINAACVKKTRDMHSVERVFPCFSTVWLHFPLSPLMPVCVSVCVWDENGGAVGVRTVSCCWEWDKNLFPLPKLTALSGGSVFSLVFFSLWGMHTETSTCMCTHTLTMVYSENRKSGSAQG